MNWTTASTLLQQPEFRIGLLTGFVVALLLVVLLRLLRRPPGMFEAFANDSGKVLVSRHALEEQIQRCCEQLNDVGKARVKVLTAKNTLLVRVRLRIRSNAKLVGISGYLQEEITTALHKNLGIENIGPIDIVVAGILPVVTKKETTSIKPEDKSQTAKSTE